MAELNLSYHSNEPCQQRLASGIVALLVIASYFVLTRRTPPKQDSSGGGTSGGGMDKKVESAAHDQARYITIWSKAVDTQMHFNEMSVKSRQLGLTFVAAALGTSVVLLSRGEDFALSFPLGEFPLQLHISVVLVLAAILALAAVRGLDLNVYHRMLRGAVTFGEDFEEQYMKRIFQLDKGMTQAISHFSRFDDAHVTDREQGKSYSGSVRRSAEDKIRAFYNNTITFLFITALALFLLTNIPTWIEVASRQPATSPGALQQNQAPSGIPQ